MAHEGQNQKRRSVSRVLISVSDKSGIVEFAKILGERDIEIISTGGTFRELSENGIMAIPIEKITNFPEMMGGRVKTLHPIIFGGILAQDSDKSEADSHNIQLIDMVVCNLYPFKEAATKGVSSEELIEQIDIGGPSLLRAASKNHERVAVVTDPSDYDWISREIGFNSKIKR